MNPYTGRKGNFILGFVRDWGIALGVAVAIFVGWSFLFGGGSLKTAGDAPDFTLADMDGTPTQLSTLQGQPVVLNFWATWCGPCKAEIPELVAWSGENEDVPLLGISVDKGLSPRALQRFVETRHMTYPVLHDRDGAVADTWGVSTLPTTIVITPDGHIGPHHVGMVDREGLDALVEEAEGHRE